MPDPCDANVLSHWSLAYILDLVSRRKASFVISWNIRVDTLIASALPLDSLTPPLVENVVIATPAASGSSELHFI